MFGRAERLWEQLEICLNFLSASYYYGVIGKKSIPCSTSEKEKNNNYFHVAKTIKVHVNHLAE
jgi:hypothetical protein